jgi:hypothetical protein
MKPTDKNKVKGTNSESFHLIVECESLLDITVYRLVVAVFVVDFVTVTVVLVFVLVSVFHSYFCISHIYLNIKI